MPATLEPAEQELFDYPCGSTQQAWPARRQKDLRAGHLSEEGPVCMLLQLHDVSHKLGVIKHGIECPRWACKCPAL